MILIRRQESKEGYLDSCLKLTEMEAEKESQDIMKATDYLHQFQRSVCKNVSLINQISTEF